MKKKKKEKKLTEIEAKRVAILKDAVKQLNAEVYNAMSSNGYVQDDELDENIEKICEIAEIVAPKGGKTELQYYMDKLINKAKPCDVCAKGALLLSSIRKFNNISLSEIQDTTLDRIASDKIRVLFGYGNADLIEDYFESGNPNHDNEDEDEEYQEDLWLELDDTQRLIRIFKNAIKHRGEFKPELEKF